jgi:hypothetical protein
MLENELKPALSAVFAPYMDEDWIIARMGIIQSRSPQSKYKSRFILEALKGITLLKGVGFILAYGCGTLYFSSICPNYKEERCANLGP